MNLPLELVPLAALSTWLAPAGLALAGGAAVLAALGLAYQALRLAFPKVAAVAITTAKEAMAQPLFGVLIFVGCCGLLAFPYIPYNTFGEDVKVVKDSGLTLIMVLAIVFAVWTSSVSIADEIEGRTAITLLSKPVTRRQFIIGKYLGILVPVVVMFVVLGVLFLTSVSYKVVYDARESSLPPPSVAQCRVEMLQIVPGLFLSFLETMVMAAISVAIATRLPMLANLLICFSIYVLGHMVSSIVNSAVGRFEIVRFMGQLIATILPMLDHFNVQPAVATGRVVPLEYLVWATIYALIYSTAMILIALVMFEDRDLA